MSLLEMLSRPECWERYYAYKTSLAFPVREAEELVRDDLSHLRGAFGCTEG